MANFKFEKLTSLFKAQVAETVQGVETVNINFSFGDKINNYTIPEGTDIITFLKILESNPTIETQISLKAEEKYSRLMKASEMLGLDLNFDIQEVVAMASTGSSFIEFATTTTTSTTTELLDDEEEEVIMDKAEIQGLGIPPEAAIFFDKENFFWARTFENLGGFRNEESKLWFTHLVVVRFNEEGIKTKIQERIRKANKINKWTVIYALPLDRDRQLLVDDIIETFNPDYKIITETIE